MNRKCQITMLTLGGLVILAAIGGLLTFDKALFSTTVVRRCAVNNGDCENESTCVEETEPNTIVSCECTVAWTGETCNLRRFNDEQCHFPFTYLNTTYTTCTDVGWGSFWCSTISEFHDGDETHRSECQDLVPYPLPDLEKLLLSERLSIPVDTVFQMMFSSHSEFIQYWMEKNKAYDVNISPWQKKMDNFSSNLFRNQTYKQKAHNVFIPSGVMSVTARQIYFADLSENGTYTVGSNYSFVGPPMSGDYYVTMRVAMRPVSSYISELRVSCAIRYHKEPAGFIKAILAAQIYPDMEKCYRALGEDLSTFYNSTQSIRMYQEARSTPDKSKLNPI